MLRVPAFRFLFARGRIITALLRFFAQVVHLAIQGANLGPQVVDDLLLLFSEVGIFAFLLRIVLTVVVIIQLAPQLVALVLLLKVVCELLASAKAITVTIAIAGVHGGTENFVARKDVVPDVLKDTPRELVVHAGGQEPLAVVLESLNWHFTYPLPRDCELRAAYARDRGWNWRARVDLLPDGPTPIDLLGLVEEIKVAAGAVHVYPVGAARIVVASHVHIAHARHPLVVEALHDLGGVEAHEHVVVPCVTMCVHEHDSVGEVIVVVDDVAEVDLVLASAELPGAACLRMYIP